jgi:hypothetical protein
MKACPGQAPATDPAGTSCAPRLQARGAHAPLALKACAGQAPAADLAGCKLSLLARFEVCKHLLRKRDLLVLLLDVLRACLIQVLLLAHQVLLRKRLQAAQLTPASAAWRQRQHSCQEPCLATSHPATSPGRAELEGRSVHAQSRLQASCHSGSRAWKPCGRSHSGVSWHSRVSRQLRLRVRMIVLSGTMQG